MKILSLFLLFCFPLLLLAQTSESPKHVGTSNQFKIGTADNPAIVEELVDFLNTKERYNSYHDNVWPCFPFNQNTPSINYFDKALMDENSDENCILCVNSSESFRQPGVYFQPCTGITIISGPQPWYHIYSVKKGCKKMIVDAVASQEVQQQFNQWRQNPTAQELCDYINDVNDSFNESHENYYSSPHDLARHEIERRYSNANLFIAADDLAKKICVGTTEKILIEKSPEEVAGKSYFVIDSMRDSFNTPLIGSDENGNYLFTLPDSNNDESFSGVPKHIKVIPGMEYFRPLKVDNNIGFVSCPRS